MNLSYYLCIFQVKRLAEGFFMFEYPKQAVLDCYDNRYLFAANVVISSK